MSTQDHEHTEVLEAKRLRYCSFCGGSEEERDFLVAADGDVFICEMCVEICRDVIGHGREMKRLMANTQAAINDICTYRGLPRVTKGAPCKVDGKPGVIWGGNDSANFNVKFDDGGHIRNCHPGWRMKIMTGDGDVLYQSDDA